MNNEELANKVRAILRDAGVQKRLDVTTDGNVVIEFDFNGFAYIIGMHADGLQTFYKEVGDQEPEGLDISTVDLLDRLEEELSLVEV